MTYLVALLLMLGAPSPDDSRVEFVSQNSSVTELVRKCTELRKRIEISGLDTPELRRLTWETGQESGALKLFARHKDMLPYAFGACSGCLVGSTAGALVGASVYHQSAIEFPDSLENPIYLMPLAFVWVIANTMGLLDAIGKGCLFGGASGTGLGSGTGWAMDAHNRRTRMNLHRKQVNVLVDRFNRALAIPKR